MRRRGNIDPVVAAELEAVDAALAGERRDPELALIVDEVRATAPRMSPAFAARMESAVDNGFAAAGAPVRKPWRPRLVPALGAAAAALAALVVGVSALSGGGGQTAVLGREGVSGVADKPAASGGASSDSLVPSTAAPSPVPSVVEEKSTAAGAGTPFVPERSATVGVDSGTSVPPPGAGPRRIERAADLTLSTPIAKLQDTSDAVTAAADRAGGYVQRSDVSASGSGGQATFDLRIPTDRLDETLATLSRLGHVRSRTQQSQDITASFSSALSRLHDARVERQALLRALATATTPQEIQSLHARLDIARSRIAAARGDLSAARRASNLARVGVTVVGVSDSAGAGADTGKPWTPGRALHDAGHLLSVAAGVAIVALAGAIPAALLALLVALAWRVHRRRRRELALNCPRPPAPAV